MDGTSPRVDAGRLAAITADELGHGLQVREDNPLTGLEGRAALLRRLGETLGRRTRGFRPGRHAAAGRAVRRIWPPQREGSALPARSILIALLHHLGPIWPGRETLGGVPILAIAGGIPASAVPMRPPG